MNLLYLSLLGIGDGVNFSGAPVRVFSPLLAAGLAAFAAWLAKLLITARRALAAPLPASMRGQMRFFVMYAAAATLESVAFTESRGRSGTCSPRAAFDHGLSPTKVRLFSDPAPQPAALCAPVGTFGFETECASWRWLVISLLEEGAGVPRGERARRRLGRGRHCVSLEALPPDYAPCSCCATCRP